MNEFPTIKWIKSKLRNNLYVSIRVKIIKAYIIGSFANGTFNDKSDLDIAIIIPTKTKISSLKFTENYHSNFISNNNKPNWKGRIIDFQFFYEFDNEFMNYIKIEIY